MRKFGTVLAAACIVVALLGTGAASAAKGGTDRPFKGGGSGTGIVDAATGTYTIDGSGNFTHFGRTQLHVDGVCTNADCTTSTFTFTETAANGDEVTGSSNSSDDGLGHFTNLDTWTGGTGRFAGASGHTTTTGTSVTDPSNPLVFHLTFTSQGTISY